MMLLRLSIILFSLLTVSSCATIIGKFKGNDGFTENPTRRSTGSMLDDSNIETIIKVNINATNAALKAAHISVISYNGLVLLIGQVPSQDLKNLVTRVAQSSSSRIVNVHNELEVAGNTTFISRSSDAWITAKVKTQMLASKNISGLRTKVVTSNGVVFLMGLVTQTQAAQAAELASHVKGVVKVVRAFEYLN